MAEKESPTATPARQEGRHENRVARREPWLSTGDPFGFLQRFSDEVDRLFDDFGVGRRSFGFPFGRTRLTQRGRGAQGGLDVWNPDIDVFHRGNELVIKADLPGLKKDDVKVEVRDDAVVIQGERRAEREEEREGVYRKERSYGSFYRAIPLPEGTITEQAKAAFKDGVLEITVPAPPEATRGRRLEITEGSKEPAGSKTSTR
jgi:HSP20 family protein